MDPYNNNPFTTDNKRDTRSESDANRELAATVQNRFEKALDDFDVYKTEGFGVGYASGVLDVATDLGVVVTRGSLNRFSKLTIKG